MSNPIVNYLASDAEALSNGNGLIITPNMTDEQRAEVGNGRNAISHTLLSAQISFHLGTDAVQVLGFMKEGYTNDPSRTDDPADTYRDIFNNEVGRRIGEYVRELSLAGDGASEAIDDLVIDAFNTDDLIKDPGSDPRVFKSEPTWSAPSDNWEIASAGRDYRGTTSIESVEIELYTYVKGIVGSVREIASFTTSVFEGFVETATNPPRFASLDPGTCRV